MGSPKKKKVAEIKYPREIVSIRRHKQIAAYAKGLTKESGLRVTNAAALETILDAHFDTK